MGLNFPFPGAPWAFAIPADQTRITARAVITIMKRFRIRTPFIGRLRLLPMTINSPVAAVNSRRSRCGIETRNACVQVASDRQLFLVIDAGRAEEQPDAGAGKDHQGEEVRTRHLNAECNGSQHMAST